MGINKNKVNKPQNPNVHDFRKNDNEYDLGKNLQKVSSHSRNSRNKAKERLSQTESSFDEHVTRGDRLVQTPVDNSSQTYSGGMSWDSYVRLDDKLTNFSESNTKAHTELRHELEEKIKDNFSKCNDSITLIRKDLSQKLDTNLFCWVIGILITVIGAIVTIWWVTSYSEVHILPSKIQDIEYSIKQLQNNMTKDVTSDSLKHVN